MKKQIKKETQHNFIEILLIRTVVESGFGHAVSGAINFITKLGCFNIVAYPKTVHSLNVTLYKASEPAEAI